MSRDPRDERVTLLRIKELDVQFPDHIMEKKSNMINEDGERVTGHLTQELRAKIDDLRFRISGGKALSGNVVDLIREERRKRTQQIERAMSGTKTRNNPKR